MNTRTSLPTSIPAAHSYPFCFAMYYIAALAICFLLLPPTSSFAQSSGSGSHEVWTARFEGAGVFNEAYNIRVNEDRVFIHGTSADSNFIGNYGTVAYDAETGTELWSALRAGEGENPAALGRGMDISPDGGKVYVTGAADMSGFDYLTLAYDAITGEELWATSYDGPAADFDAGFALRVSPDGSRVFVSGHSTGNGTAVDYTTFAYDAVTGDELWVARYDGPANSIDELASSGLEISPDGSRVFITGKSQSNDTGLDYATVAYDAATGDELWASRYNGDANTDDEAYAMAISADGNHVYITGWSAGAGTGDDHATVAYNADTGEELWVSRFNGPADDFDRAFAIAVHPTEDNVYVTGTITGTEGRELLTTAYDAGNGDELWGTTYKEPGNDFVTAWAVEVHPGGSRVYAAGGITIGTVRNWVTLAYDATTGDTLWTEPFTNEEPGSGANEAEALAISPNGSMLFATGAFEFDYATAAYAITGTIADEASPDEVAGRLGLPNPNPVNRIATLTVAVENGQNVSVEIFDLTGRRIQTLYNGALASGMSKTLTLDASKLPSGVYAVRATGEDFSETQRVTVVR